ncbi:hypothetical protein AB833_03870 [Chromatiales bacterium (ex Bugula neritina AB1)]|nr:hypothetical protein AB833_03870 [Chromatiales bacterium (ex Bugula neritina AB1)]
MLNLVVALPSEAQPLIDAFGLSRQQQSQAFPVYQSADCCLVVSGIGRCHSAAATAWLAALNPVKNAAWVNIGIAGHKNKPVGSAFCAHSIEDMAVSRTWYPVQIASTLDSLALQTTDYPIINYGNNTLHDMEASGYVQIALKYSTAELVQCVKVISDNENSPASTIDKSKAQLLIGERIDEIRTYTNHLLTLAEELKPTDIQAMLSLFTAQWRFSVTQKRQLHRLLERHQLLLGDLDHLPGELTQLKSTSEALAWLHAGLSAIAFEPAT